MAFEQERRADALYAILEKYAPYISKSMREAWEQGKLRIVLSDLTALLEAGRVDDAIRLVMQGANPIFTEKAEESLREAFVAAAEWSWVYDMPRTTKTFRTMFDKMNPETISAMKANELRMVQQVQSETRDGLKQFLVNALNSGIGPKEIARQIRNEPVFGLTASQEATVGRYRTFLETVHEKRSIQRLGIGLKRSLSVDARGKPIDGIELWRLRDMRFDRTIARANRESKPLTKEKIEEMVTAYRRRSIKLRSETIARTEMIKSGALGSRESWRQMVKAGVFPNGVLRYWFTSKTERVCPYCKAMARLNTNGRGLDEPFIDINGEPVDNPPGHPGCACVVFVRPAPKP